MHITPMREVGNQLSCCLKMVREDGCEFSAAFDNSLGALEHLSRIEICIYRTVERADNKPIYTTYPATDAEVVKEMQDFLSGFKY